MPAPFHVLHEDNHLLIVGKSAGVLVQGDQTGDKCLLDYCKEYLKTKYNKPGAVFLGTVHRLDRPVSGAVVFARTSKALARMNQLFQERRLNKTYWAVVKHKPTSPQDKLIHYLVKNEKQNKTTAYDAPRQGALRAELKYKVLGHLNDHFLLEVKPLTGRPHQIRVQLAAIGCPIRGDIKYGFPKPNPDASIHLHARALDFIHPVKQTPIKIIVGLPANAFWEQFLTLDPSHVQIGKRDKYMDSMY